MQWWEDWVKQFEQFADSQGMEEHKTSLNKVEYERYSHQYKLIKDLNEVYEKEPDNFTKIVNLMQKMQECGQPPSDIVAELASDIDLANLGQM
ncbi:hypothetical protein K2173_020331 [Erythroxylum novogranatense]|uniref:Uncharacterized protein n=1 Tax=Erythroxylum novogranatense TaxID=1862640 RepID=A0AAV8U7L5_9ROSI|nr:hypothetical protein K2173_020331 [Erythroxylum novogranatense]